MGSVRTTVLRIALGAMILSISLGGVVDGSTRYEDGSLVLKMQPGYSVDGVVAELDATVDKQLSQLEIYLLALPVGPDLDSLAAVVAGWTGVAFCQPNFLVDPLRGVQGSLPVSDQQRTGDFRSQEAAVHLGLDQVHVQATGAGVRVAVLDGGVNYEHPVLADNIFQRRDYVDSDNDPFDEEGGGNSGHGTFVAGVTRLVAPEADIYVYRVTNLEGLGNSYVLAEAIIQAVNDGCRVINLSLVTMDRHDAIAAAAAYAAEHDVLIVAAAGNGHTPGAHFPASDPNVLAVAAVDTLDLLADFSCYGSNIDVCAPGTGLYGPYLEDGYAWWGGTSFAAPFVAAQAALLWYYEPSATRQEVIDAILSTATGLDHLNEDLAGQLGYGLINPLQSIIMIRGGSLALRVPSEYPTIQAAIDASLPGDTVLIAPGEYSENVVIGQNTALLLLGEMGAEHTRLLPASLDLPIITIDPPRYAEEVPEIAGLTFTGASGPPAIRFVYAGANIHDNVFRDNHIYERPYSVWYQSYPSVIYVLGDEDLRTDISRNFFINNGGETAIRLVIVGPGGQANVVNNTFYGNDRALMNDSHWLGTPEFFDFNIYGNIFAHCRYEAVADATDEERVDMELADLAFNLFWDNGASWEEHLDFDSGAQVFGDPVFVNRFQGDLRLLPGSAAIDAGDPDPLINDPDGSRNDVGALWYEELPLPYARDFEIVSVHTLVPELRWEYVDDQPTTQQIYQIQVGTDPYWDVAETWDSGPINGPEADIIYSGPLLSSFTTYYFRVRLHNGIQWGDWYDISARFKAAGPIRVPSDLASIQEAVDLAEEGDTILIEPGTYQESVIAASTGLVFMSTAGADFTFLRSRAGTAATISLVQGDSLVTIVGLGFTEGSCGVLAADGSRCEVRDCRFTGLSENALLSSGGESVSVVNCEFIENYRACRLSGDEYRFDSNFVTGSSQASCLWAGIGYARNNIFARNEQSVQTAYSNHIEFANNTIYGTEGTGVTIGCPGDYYNNLVVFNRGVGISAGSSGTNVRYNNSFGNHLANRSGYTESLGGLSADPLIIDTSSNDLVVRFDSPCLDAGDPNPALNDPDGSRSDIGAVSGSPFNYPIAANVSLSPANAYGVLKSGTPVIAWVYLDPSMTTQYQYEAEVGTAPLWAGSPLWTSGAVASSDQSIDYDGLPLEDHRTYYLRIRVHDGAEWGDWNHAVVRVSISGRVRVPEDHSIISAAVSASFDGDSVIVGPGTYADSIDFAGKAIVLTSSDGPEVTTITHAVASQTLLITLTSGEPVFATVSNLTMRNTQGGALAVKGSAARVEGCIFINCKTTPLVIDKATDQVVVRNNKFLYCSNNFRSAGGVSVRESSALVEANSFKNLGSDGNGGAMYLAAAINTTVRRNLFINNISDAGGAIWSYNGINLKIEGNTFCGNKTDPRAEYVPGELGGACLSILQTNGKDIDIRNNVFAFNGPGWAVLSNVDVTFLYNDLFMNTEGNCLGVVPDAGCIASDPMFVDRTSGDFHLMAGSPCIDAGDPGMEFVESDGSFADMGAFPYQVPEILPVAEHINMDDENPRRVMSLTPTFYWGFKDDGDTQQLFELNLSVFPTTWESGQFWTSGEIVSSDSSADYTGPDLVRGGNYLVRIRVNDGNDWGSWSYFTLHVNSGPTTPIANSSRFPYRHYIKTLSVAACTDPESDSIHYDLQFASDVAMEHIIGSVENSATPSLELDFEGELQTVYHWRVRATDGLITTPWAQTTFTTCGPGGQVELLSSTEPEIACDQIVRFVIGLYNDQALPICATINGFTVTSPGNAVFEPIEAGWILEPPISDSGYQGFKLMEAYEKHHGTVDSVTFLGAVFPTADNLLPAGARGAAWYIETQVSCDEVGKQICIDRVSHDTRGYETWDWYYGDNRGGDEDRTYPDWGGPYCFTIAHCCQDVRGDANDDGVECTIGDIATLVDHLFITGQELACLEESNLNADPEGAISIGDITYGVDHLFISQRDLISCTQLAGTPQAKAVAEPTLWRSVRNDTTSLYVSTETILRGVQLSLVGEGTAAARKLTELGLDLVQGRQGDTLNVGLVDLDGPTVIDKGDWWLVSVPGVYQVVHAEAADMAHQKLVLALKDGNPTLPTRFELSQNYPNPFNPITRIEFALPKPSPVKITVINILGQTVDVLVDRSLPAGYHSVDWNADRYASGVYFYRLKAGEFSESRKMLLLK